MKFPKILILILFLAAFLRLWNIDKVPVSLFGDEVDEGYHAYSILKTGKDYTGHTAIFDLTSLADRKAPLYSYLMVPSIAVFGISPLGVRLPAALFGVLGVLAIYLLANLLINRNVALLSAALLAVSPWHIQFSRWGLEHTLMLSLFILGLYFFLKSFNEGSRLIIASILFGLSFYSYHAAKIFLPLLLICMVLIYGRQIKNIPIKFLTASLLLLVLIAGPMMVNTFFGDSAQRFGSLSIFNDPKNVGEIGFNRVRDEAMKIPLSNFFHNKITLNFEKIENNYLQAFSAEFLFIRGDTNLRHSILQNGEFYKYQLVFLILGLSFLVTKLAGKENKLLLLTLLLLSPFPGVFTEGGGNHAPRLIFMLPVMIVLIALGMYYSFVSLNKKFRRISVFGVGLIALLSFIFYLHNYYIHYPWDSQKWWNAGYNEAVKSAVSEGQKYDKVIISSADEPSLIFFLALSAYPPRDFQNQLPLVDSKLDKIGSVQRLDKYYFTPIGSGIGLYDLGSKLPDNTLYVATAKEIVLDLVKEPGRVPSDIILIKSITNPSGDPVFYLLTKSGNKK